MRKDRLACWLEEIDLNDQQDVWSLDTSRTLGAVDKNENNEKCGGQLEISCEAYF